MVILQKPYAATAKEWREWEKTARDSQPIAYWLNEVALDGLNRMVSKAVYPFDALRTFVRYRIFDRYHVINTGLEPGYQDADTRILHGMFNLLVDFVEVEKAWMHVVFDGDERSRRRYPWWSIGWLRFKSHRDPAAGIDHLRWETTLDSPDRHESDRSVTQAETARELLVLYYWWKNIRPNRVDPMVASGWSAYCDERRSNTDGSAWELLDFEDETAAEKARTQILLDENRRIEAEYDREDDEMLMRLIKIRKAMWT